MMLLRRIIMGLLLSLYTLLALSLLPDDMAKGCLRGGQARLSVNSALLCFQQERKKLREERREDPTERDKGEQKPNERESEREREREREREVYAQ